MASNIINSRPHVLAGRLRVLGISTAKRSALYPEVPTVAESGVPGYQADVWYGVLAPAKTPGHVVTQLNGEIVTVLRSKDVRDKLAALGSEAAPSTPQHFAELMRKDIAKWAQVTSTLDLQMK
jgi:tripartite-type tricarboxylate transporter receptor subunit TctC